MKSGFGLQSVLLRPGWFYFFVFSDFVILYFVISQFNQKLYFVSPEGSFTGTPVGIALPKSGVPSGFHEKGCIRTSRSQPGFVDFLE